MATGSLAGMAERNDLEVLLRRQHGAVSRIQLRQTGLSTNTIESWVRRGRLRRLLHGVYCVGAPSLLTRAHAAYLWQPHGVVSHLAAAHLWRMAVDAQLVHLTVPRGCSRRSSVPWLRLFRRDTPRNRRSTVGGLPVTDVPRTVFDCLTLARRHRRRCAARPRHGHADLGPGAVDVLLRGPRVAWLTTNRAAPGSAGARRGIRTRAHPGPGPAR